MNGQFQDREQIDTAIANSKKVIEEARRRNIEVIHVRMVLEPAYRVLGEGKYGLRKMVRDYGSFLGEQTEFFPGFEPLDGEYTISERTGGSSAFAATTLDSYLRNNRIFDIYVMGFALRQCVESTVRNAHDLGYHQRHLRCVGGLHQGAADLVPERHRTLLRKCYHDAAIPDASVSRCDA
ncbi:isochorismatase family cysteine hydrolase [Rhizobium gallicum]|uniref:isochorismatase family cysteine hydrolase n=1 Tax=Rhizobium gallicum TaxID=56730 RepID=UPI00300354C6